MCVCLCAVRFTFICFPFRLLQRLTVAAEGRASLARAASEPCNYFPALLTHPLPAHRPLCAWFRCRKKKKKNVRKRSCSRRKRSLCCWRFFWPKPGGSCSARGVGLAEKSKHYALSESDVRWYVCVHRAKRDDSRDPILYLILMCVFIHERERAREREVSMLIIHHYRVCSACVCVCATFKPGEKG